jgi:hypothetical protein
MHHWTKRLFALAAPLLLTGCLWGPGKFVSDLTIRKDGGFVLDYRGEIILQLPPDESTDPWTDAKAKCTESGKERPCTKVEIADQKTAYDKKRQDANRWPRCLAFPVSTKRPTARLPPS